MTAYVCAAEGRLIKIHRGTFIIAVVFGRPGGRSAPGGYLSYFFSLGSIRARLDSLDAICCTACTECLVLERCNWLTS